MQSNERSLGELMFHEDILKLELRPFEIAEQRSRKQRAIGYCLNVRAQLENGASEIEVPQFDMLDSEPIPVVKQLIKEVFGSAGWDVFDGSCDSTLLITEAADVLDVTDKKSRRECYRPVVIG